MRPLAIVGLVIGHACTCGDVGVSNRRYACSADGDCAGGYACIGGECVAAGDAGSVGTDGGGPDSGVTGSDSGVMDGGPGGDAGPGVDGGAGDAGTPDFSISITLSTVTALYCGDDPTATVNVTSLNGFSGTVALSVSGAPAGSSVTVSPTSIAGSAGSSTLTLSVGSATPGSYPVHVTGASGGLQHTATVTFSVPGALFADDFNRSTGLGGNWSVPYGSYSTSTAGGGQAISGSPPTAGNWAAAASPALGTDNYCVTANLMIPANANDTGIVARSVGSDFTSDLYAAQVWTDGNVYLFRRNNWNWTQLASNSAGITAGTVYKLSLIVIGSSPTHLEVWLDGSRQITIDDSTDIATGIAGMMTYYQNVQYGAFRVYPQ